MNRREFITLAAALPVLTRCEGQLNEPELVRIHSVIPNSLRHYRATGEKLGYIEVR